VQCRRGDAAGEGDRLGRELEQVAIFWFDGKRFWIIGALMEADPLMPAAELVRLARETRLERKRPTLIGASAFRFVVQARGHQLEG